MTKPRITGVLLSLCVLVPAYSSAAMAAGCTSPFKFCDDCTTHISIFTKRNTACTISYRIVGGAVFSQHVTRRGTGLYGTAGATSGAYQPRANFVGSDHFEVEVRYERHGRKLRTLIQADVRVSD